MNQILRRAIEQRTGHKALERVLKALRELVAKLGRGVTVTSSVRPNLVFGSDSGGQQVERRLQLPAVAVEPDRGVEDRPRRQATAADAPGALLRYQRAHLG